jgi:hypothetical protein
MTVKELISLLEGFHQDEPVMVETNYTEYACDCANCTCAPISVEQTTYGEVEAVTLYKKSGASVGLVTIRSKKNDDT